MKIRQESYLLSFGFHHQLKLIVMLTEDSHILALMDPLSALSLAGKIIQFVDFTQSYFQHRNLDAAKPFFSRDLPRLYSGLPTLSMHRETHLTGIANF